MEQPVTHSLRIHGDNILECENTLKLLSNSLNGGKYKLHSGPAYCPVYTFKSDTNEIFNVQLFAGYGRWSFPLADYISSIGGELRESPDSIVTKIEEHSGVLYEKPLLAFEFSGALPAGNNAWQRTGRALALAYAGIPYLYFAELGGQELDSERVMKASRFPNPLVPFAYAVLGASSGSISLPVYIPSPSSNKDIVEVYKDCFGDKESVQLVRGILLSQDVQEVREVLEKKVSKILGVLSGQRKRVNNILKPEEWDLLYEQKTGNEKASWLIAKAMPWNKKLGIKDLTPTFKTLVRETTEIGAVPAGSKEMPICLIPQDKRKTFSEKIQSIYTDKVNDGFTEWVGNISRPLVCVWVAGFKPKGDDSRPDRGLVPLARMVFGKDVDLLTIVYGPAKPSAWSLLESNMSKLATSNGLWEAVLGLSNALLIDSPTSSQLQTKGFVLERRSSEIERKLLTAAETTPKFGEHDIDSVLHLFFSNAKDNGVYESLCNPPGGDWSGIGVYNFQTKEEYRWTSLPRVSGNDSKRPDHLIQVDSPSYFLSIESKDTEPKLEGDIGPRLVRYVQTLLEKAPISIKRKDSDIWEQYTGLKLSPSNFLSGAAFRFKSVDELQQSLVRSQTDLVIGVEFSSMETVLHLLLSEKAKVLIPTLTQLSEKLKGIISLDIH